MNQPAKILFQSFVMPFYRENAGILVFIFTMMFFVVSEQSGADLFEYHVMLVTGVLENISMLLLVCLIWFLYSRKFVAFVSNEMQQPVYAFIHIFNCLSKPKQFRLFFIMEIWLLMPVLLYSVFIVMIGYQRHDYIPVIFIIGYLLLLCSGAAAWHVYQLNNLHKSTLLLFKNIRLWPALSTTYPVILLKFVAGKQKMIWTGIWLFTCGILYCIACNNPLHDFDANTVFLIFNFGILANGVIVYRVREFEETYLTFYRGAPVPVWKRWLQYALVYFVLLIPEFITIGMLVPLHMHYGDAVRFCLCGYSLLLLMNSVTFLHHFSRQAYIKVLLLIFCIQYIFLVITGLTALYLLFFGLAIIFISVGYYKFERS
jgi:hypothetical protein